MFDSYRVGDSRGSLRQAANDPVTMIPDLLPVIRDGDRRQQNPNWQRRPMRKQPVPAPQSQRVPNSDPEHRVDDYA